MPDQINSQSGILGGIQNNVYLAVIVVFILSLMILPIPPFLMDVFLVMSITGSLVILFVSLYINQPLEFSVFPSVLLIVTLFRLSLNVATTRLILSEGYAGEMINTFGSFVIGGNYVVGIVIFVILVIINYIVITKGATRIAEVSARFTLDAMPGKQMAIDADLNAGLIDDREARDRRQKITSEAEFYGAMDGAAKFVRGDAIAGLLITSVNIIGGLAIGVLQNDLTLAEAANVYTVLTVGDGLVAQIPALIVSTSAGIIITRATGHESMGSQIATQLGNQPKAVFVSAGILLVMGILPGLPFLPFSLMAVAVGSIAYITSKKHKEEQELKEKLEKEEEEAQEEEEDIEEYLQPDPFEIEIGYGLISLVDQENGGNLLDRISTIRKSLAVEMGIIVPPIRIRDNVELESNQYLLKIYGIKEAEGEVILDNYMVLNPDDRIDLQGYETTEPTFELPAVWISEDEKEKAEAAGYNVIEPPAIIATHLMEILKDNAHKLLTRQETKRMIDHLEKEYPAVVEEVVPDMVSVGTVTEILKKLLEERVPICNLVKILETIANNINISNDPTVLTEQVRKGLSDTITDHLLDGRDQLEVMTFDPRIEDHIINIVQQGEGDMQNLGFAPEQVGDLFDDMSSYIEEFTNKGVPPVILVSPPIRRAVRNFVEPILPKLHVVAYSELTSDTDIKTIGTIELPQ